MKLLLPMLRLGIGALFTIFTLGVLALAGTYLYLQPRLPSTDTLKDVRLQVPLRVYTGDGKLIAEFGEWRRIPVSFKQIPDQMVQAFLAAEDDRFFTHPGVDYQGLARAGVELVRTGEKRQGGSTITMQVARNFFLTSEKTYLRKLSEIMLALKIERELGKEDILELYLNKIYLGNRAYGVGAAAQIYYGRALDELTLAQTAMIAGLPKAPSRTNPINDPPRAVARRDWVLSRMRDLGYIDEQRFQAAVAEPDAAQLHALAVEMEAPYIAEMARARLVEQYGEAAYTEGLRVITTLDSRLQTAAVDALRGALVDYDERHGYRGPEDRPAGAADPASRTSMLERMAPVGGLQPGLVVEVTERAAKVRVRGGDVVEVPWEGFSWARPYMETDARGPEPRSAGDIVRPGDLVRLRPTAQGWRLAQVPAVEGALVALDPTDGAVTALVGGFDFFRSKFNRAVQAQRQPGSSFKPFIYSAALERGYTAASIINDAPIVYEDDTRSWRPENYGREFHGPTRLREALTYSRNLVSIRLLRDIGVGFAIEHAAHFGFAPERLPRNLSLALGTGTLSPLELATGYAVFANGGFLVTPYFISRVESSDGQVLFEATPARACPECEKAEVGQGEATVVPAVPPEPEPDAADMADSELLQPLAPRVASAQNVYLMTSMMQDVIRRGTATQARELGRGDLAGKTGTTNDQRDAWFSGFNRKVVATAWVGFDQLQPLGKRETGGRAALPMWIAYMRAALEGVPEQLPEQPPGLVTIRIDPQTGRAATAYDRDAVFEIFAAGSVPGAEPDGATPPGTQAPASAGYRSDQLF